MRKSKGAGLPSKLWAIRSQISRWTGTW